MKINTRLVLKRLDAGLKQYELAELSELDPAQLSRIERGRENATVEVQKRIARGLKVKVSEIF